MKQHAYQFEHEILCFNIGQNGFAFCLFFGGGGESGLYNPSQVCFIIIAQYQKSASCLNWFTNLYNNQQKLN